MGKLFEWISSLRFSDELAPVGRQNTAWKMFDYIPTDWVDPSGATGLMTREASRTLEVGAVYWSSTMQSMLTADLLSMP